MKKALLILILLQVSAFLWAQELLLNSFKLSLTDISGRENQVLDLNNEPCALLKVRTGVGDLKFSSNLSIERTEQKEGEYWIWVSPKTTVIKIFGPDLPLTEIKLPTAVESNNVYILILTVVYPERIIYRDVYDSYVSFTSKPSQAEVYINDVFQGTTPLKIAIPEGNYSFSLKKEKYLTVSGIDSIVSKISEKEVQLELDQKHKRFYTSISAGYIDGAGIAGITFGRIGRTGWYASAKFSYTNVSPDVGISNTVSGYSDRFMPLKEDVKNYWYETSPFGFSNILLLSAGLNQQVARKLFLNIGAGYSQNNSYIKLTKIPYNTDAIPGTLEWFYVVRDAYGHLFDESYKGFNINYGVTWRVGNTILLIAEVMNNFGASGEFGFSPYRETAFSLGLGVNF
jgi:hypothetical protein